VSGQRVPRVRLPGSMATLSKPPLPPHTHTHSHRAGEAADNAKAAISQGTEGTQNRASEIADSAKHNP
jgi:hypothetical protein